MPRIICCIFTTHGSSVARMRLLIFGAFSAMVALVTPTAGADTACCLLLMPLQAELPPRRRCVLASSESASGRDWYDVMEESESVSRLLGNSLVNPRSLHPRIGLSAKNCWVGFTST